MNPRVILSLLLVCGLVLAGCQKDSSSEGEEKALAMAVRSLEGKLERMEKRLADLEKKGAAPKVAQAVSVDSGAVDDILASFNEKLYNMA